MNLKKDIFWNTIGNFAYLGALWLMSMLVVRLSGFVDAGRLSLAMTSANIYMALASYTMRLFYAADISKEYSDGQYCFARLITTALSIMLCMGASFLIGYSSIQIKVIFLFYLYKTEEMLSDVLFGVMQRYGKLYISGYSMTLKAVMSLLTFVVVLHITGDLVLALGMLVLIGALVILLIDYRVARRLANIKFFWKSDIEKVKCLLKLCFPLFIVGLCWNIIPSIPRLVFERMYTEREMGFYSSISTIAVLISTAANCVFVPLTPRFSEYYQKKDRTALKNISILSEGAVILFGVFCLILERAYGKRLLTLLFGKEIIPYVSVFKWVIIASVLTALIACMNAFFTAVNQRKTLMIAALSGAIICVITAVPFCRNYYMMGVTGNLILSQMIEIIILIIAMLRVISRIEVKG